MGLGIGGTVIARARAVLEADTRSMDRGLSKSEKQWREYGRNTSRVIMGVGAATATGLGYAANEAGKFEQTLNSLQAVAGANAEQMRLVSAAAKKLGADVKLPGTSAADAALAMTELAKGGLSVVQSMKAARGTLQLAAAAQIENAEAATITARALNGFGLGGGEATRVADLLANAANASTGEISDFAMALQQSSAVAKDTGLSIDETVAALMGLHNAGVVGSDAGTSLKTMLQRLTPATGTAADEMKRLKIDVYDANGQFVGIRDAIKIYQERLSRLNPEQRKTSMQILFGSDAIRAANLVLLEGTEAHDKNMKAVQRRGAAEDLAAAKMKGFKGTVEGLTSATETLAIEIGEDLLPVLTEGTEDLTALVGVAEKHEKITKIAIGTVLGLAAAVVAVNVAMKLYATYTAIATVATAAATAVQRSYRASLWATAAAGGKVTAATRAMAAATALSSVAMKASGATALKGMLMGLFSVVRAHPLGAFATIAAIAGGAILKFADDTDKSAQASKRAKKAADDLKGSMRSLAGDALAEQDALLALHSAQMELQAARQSAKKVNADETSTARQRREASLREAQALQGVRHAEVDLKTAREKSEASREANSKAVERSRKVLEDEAAVQKELRAKINHYTEAMNEGGNASSNYSARIAVLNRKFRESDERVRKATDALDDAKGPMKEYGRAVGGMSPQVTEFNDTLLRAHELTTDLKKVWSNFADTVGGQIKITKSNLSGLPGALSGAAPPKVGSGDGVFGSSPRRDVAPGLWDELAIAEAGGLHVGSTHRPGSVTSSGNKSLHGEYPSKAFDAGDGSNSGWSSPRMRAVFNAMAGRPGIDEVILSPYWWHPGSGLTLINHAGVLAQHWDHVHVGSRSGGDGKVGVGDGKVGVGDGKVGARKARKAKPPKPKPYKKRPIPKWKSTPARFSKRKTGEAEIDRMIAAYDRRELVRQNLEQEYSTTDSELALNDPASFVVTRKGAEVDPVTGEVHEYEYEEVDFAAVNQEQADSDRLIDLQSQIGRVVSDLRAKADKIRAKIESVVAKVKKGINAHQTQINRVRDRIKTLRAQLGTAKKQKKPAKGVIKDIERELSGNESALDGLRDAKGDLLERKGNLDSVGPEWAQKSVDLGFDERETAVRIAQLRQQRDEVTASKAESFDLAGWRKSTFTASDAGAGSSTAEVEAQIQERIRAESSAIMSARSRFQSDFASNVFAPGRAGAGRARYEDGATSSREVTINNNFTRQPEDPWVWIKKSQFAADNVFGG